MLGSLKGANVALGAGLGKGAWPPERFGEGPAGRGVWKRSGWKGRGVAYGRGGFPASRPGRD